MYWEDLLIRMGIFGDKKGWFGDMYSSGLSFVKLSMDIINKQTSCKLLRNTLITSTYISSF